MRRTAAESYLRRSGDRELRAFNPTAGEAEEGLQSEFIEPVDYGSRMNATKLITAAASLPVHGWKSLVLGRVANTHVKLFRVDRAGLPTELHPAWAESLIMIEGEIRLDLGGEIHRLQAGDHVYIPAGTPHSILPGGHGAFLLVDPDGLV